MYSSSDLRLPAFAATFAGFVPNELLRQTTESASSRARRISTSADLGATWAPLADDRLRVQETFRYAAARIPGSATLNFASLFATSATAAILANCQPPATNCPLHAPLS